MRGRHRLVGFGGESLDDVAATAAGMATIVRAAALMMLNGRIFFSWCVDAF